MRDINFHEITLTGEDHRLISADAKAYRIIGSDTYSSFEDYVMEEYRENFIKKLELLDDNWFPARLKNGSDKSLYYMRASRKENSDMIRLIMVNIDDLMGAYARLNRDINSYKAQLDLYEDVFFEYNPSLDIVKVYNTEQAMFDSGIYTLDDFEEFLLTNAKGRHRQVVKGFIGQIRAKAGRYTARVDANLLNEDTNVTYTQLEESFVFYDKESEGVVGHIHLGTNKGVTKATSIKHDSLTGLVDKSDIIRIAKERIDDRRLDGTTLVIIDIDFFKSINDTYGHQVGDEVIKKIADIISSEIGNEGISGRFGGDEFLVVIYNVQDEDELRAKLKNIKNMVSATFPNSGIDENTPLSVSIGSATYPKDADSYEDIFMLADYCLYMAKDKGRNRYIIYTLAKHGTLDSIRQKRQNLKKINERDLPLGEVIVKMFDMTLHGAGSTPEHFMDEFAEAFELQHMTLFVGEPFFCKYSAGTEVIRDQAAQDFLLGILNSDAREKYFSDQNFIVVNRIENLPPYAKSVQDFLKDLGVYSYVMIRFRDKDDRPCVLIIASIGKFTQWNQTHYKFYRAFTDLLGLYSLN